MFPSQRGLRLWCAYEAHLASEQGKVILIARGPIGNYYLQAVPCLVLATALGAVLGVVTRRLGDARRVDASLAFGLFVVAVLMLGALVHGPQKRRALNLCGAAGSAFMVLSWKAHHFWLPLPTGSELVPRILQHWVIVSALCSFWLAEAGCFHTSSSQG